MSSVKWFWVVVVFHHADDDTKNYQEKQVKRALEEIIR